MSRRIAKGYEADPPLFFGCYPVWNVEQAFLMLQNVNFIYRAPEGQFIVHRHTQSANPFAKQQGRAHIDLYNILI
ncbi:MAG: hypothetical protein ABW166_20155 [Sedimenticola sp.]